MKKLIFIVLFCFLILLNYSTLFSQINPTESPNCQSGEDCSNTAEEGFFTIEVNNCMYKIWVFIYTCGCPGTNCRYEIQIDYIDILSSDLSCSNDDIFKTLLDRAVLKCLDISAEIFEIQNPTNPYRVVVNKPACWHLATYDNTKIIPCGTDQPCCTIDVEVKENGNQDIVFVQNVNPQTTSQVQCESMGINCANYCNTAIDPPLVVDQPVYPFIDEDDPCPEECYWRLIGNHILPLEEKFIGTLTNYPLEFRVHNMKAMKIIPYRNFNNVEEVRVEIGGQYSGQLYEDSKLTVNGAILSKEVIVSSDDWSLWPDFIFDENYSINSLEFVSEYIKTNKKLPGIPSKDDVLKDGLKIGEFQSKLLQKIEEITLYLIKLNEENLELRKKIKEIEQKIIK